VRCLAREYTDRVRVAAKQMKTYEARLDRSTILPDYAITIRPVKTKFQVN
jgi:hypothetical protein